MEPTTTPNPTDPTPTPATPAPTDAGIPQTVAEKYPDLVAMLKKTESMTKEERDYWFQILPIMTEDQVARLRKILEEEAAQLAKLDAEYQTELAKLNKKHLEEWDTFERTQEREALKAKEASTEKEEKEAEEKLLASLDKPEAPRV